MHNEKTTIFIDGSSGTAGLRIYDRLAQREDIDLLTLPPELHHDMEAQRELINRADIAFLCLPDAAAITAADLVENPDTVVLDTSTAHRTAPGWTYGFPELSPEREAAIRTAKRIAVPGCHASGFIVLVYPLVEAGILPPDALLTCYSLTGYSGGGKKMIAQYEAEDRAALDPVKDPLKSPRQYGISQMHKHLPEIKAATGLTQAPAFMPVVADYYSGMEVTIPVTGIQGGIGAVKKVMKEYYEGQVLVSAVDEMDDNGFIAANRLAGTNRLEVTVSGNDDHILLVATYDNLGKGASGAAIQNMNIMLGIDEGKGLL